MHGMTLVVVVGGAKPIIKSLSILQIIHHYDIILITEIRDKSETMIYSFLENVNRSAAQPLPLPHPLHFVVVVVTVRLMMVHTTIS
jgi:hypothetical protein